MENELLKASKRAHELLMGFMLNPQQMEIVCQLSDAIEQANSTRES
jgi:hypothetical protein